MNPSLLIERQQARVQNLRSAFRSAVRHFESLERLTDGHYVALSEFRMETNRRIESVREVRLPELPAAKVPQTSVQSVSKVPARCPDPAS